MLRDATESGYSGVAIPALPRKSDVPLLIDGYNLLHVTGLFGWGGAGSFERSRAALLSFLTQALDEAELPLTTIVFDASEAPPGLPNEYNVQGLRVLYARDHESADELLEEIIAAHHSPKRLIVVSSDHRVQRAATRKKATAIDSHVWYADLHARLNARGTRPRQLDVKPEAPLSPGEVAQWLLAFGPIEITDADLVTPEPRRPASKDQPTLRKKPVKKGRKPTTKARADTPRREIAPSQKPSARQKRPLAKRPPRRAGKPKDLGFGSLENPFPPGYGEDLLGEA